MHAEVQPNTGHRTATGVAPAAWQPASKRLFANFMRTRVAKPLATGLTSLAVLGGLVAAQPAFAEGIKGDPEAAKAKISMCSGCHAIPGYRASFPSVYRVPLIAGQSEQYLASALTAYRKGDRNHPTMRGIAGSLSDQDIADLAAFYAQAN